MDPAPLAIRGFFALPDRNRILDSFHEPLDGSKCFGPMACGYAHDYACLAHRNSSETMHNDTLTERPTIECTRSQTIQVMHRCCLMSFVLESMRHNTSCSAPSGTYKKHSYGLLDGTISLELFYNATDHKLITDALTTGAEAVALVAWSTSKSISGNALVESLSITVAPNGVATANIELRFTNGAISTDFS